MKAILTFVFFIFITSTAMANTAEKEVQVETFSYGVAFNIKIETSEVQKTEVARVHKFKNDRVKKALQFTTKADKPKMA